jgi:hypothetical protein
MTRDASVPAPAVRWAVAGAALGGLAVLGLRLGVGSMAFGPNAPPAAPSSWQAFDLLALICPMPLLLWPQGGFDLFHWGHVVLAALANALLYALLAAMIWLGLSRSKRLLLAPAMLLLALWYAVWPA